MCYHKNKDKKMTAVYKPIPAISLCLMLSGLRVLTVPCCEKATYPYTMYTGRQVEQIK